MIQRLIPSDARAKVSSVRVQEITSSSISSGSPSANLSVQEVRGIEAVVGGNWMIRMPSRREGHTAEKMGLPSRKGVASPEEVAIQGECHRWDSPASLTSWLNRFRQRASALWYSLAS